MNKAQKLLNKISEAEVSLAAQSIARKAALRADAVQKLIDDNDLDGNQLATLVQKGELKADDDILIALVGKPGPRKKAIAKIKGMMK